MFRPPSCGRPVTWIWVFSGVFDSQSAELKTGFCQNVSSGDINMLLLVGVSPLSLHGQPHVDVWSAAQGELSCIHNEGMLCQTGDLCEESGRTTTARAPHFYGSKKHAGRQSHLKGSNACQQYTVWPWSMYLCLPVRRTVPILLNSTFSEEWRP